MGTIADKTAALASTKADIKSALQEQGQRVNDVFSTYGDAIRSIAPGVSSFNGRTGNVIPESDDYSASMIKFTDGQTFQQKYDAGQLTGPAGANGSNGQDGSPGADGEDGGYYQPTVDGSGNLTWTASKSGMPAVSGANIKGATGPAGTNGKDATINGVNALTLEVVEGAGIVGTQTGTTFKIDATELFQSVSDGKSAVAAAITDKGVETAADATFQQMADNIAAIQTGGGIVEWQSVTIIGESFGKLTNFSYDFENVGNKNFVCYYETGPDIAILKSGSTNAIFANGNASFRIGSITRYENGTVHFSADDTSFLGSATIYYAVF